MKTTSQGYSFFAATSIVVSNMVGMGLFMSVGTQAAMVPSATGILLLWLLGGVQALCGVIVYRQLITIFPRSGGEYTFLTGLVGPATGYAGGLVSIIIGFAAPIALAAVALATCLSAWIAVPGPLLAAGIVVGASLLHAAGIAASGRFQICAAALLLVLILAFVIAGSIRAASLHMTAPPIGFDANLVTSSGFAAALIPVAYAYSGWNAAAYFSGEVVRTGRDAGRAMAAGTLIVIALATALHGVFLMSVPVEELSGRPDAGSYVAGRLFGGQGQQWMDLGLTVVLFTSIAGMIVPGSRVIAEVGGKLLPRCGLNRRGSTAVPRRAIMVQMVIVVALILTASFGQILLVAGSALVLSTAITVGAVLRRWSFVTSGMTRSAVLRFGSALVVVLMVSAWMLIDVLTEGFVLHLAVMGLIGAATIAADLSGFSSRGPHGVSGSPHGGEVCRQRGRVVDPLITSEDGDDHDTGQHENPQRPSNRQSTVPGPGTPAQGSNTSDVKEGRSGWS